MRNRIVLCACLALAALTFAPFYAHVLEWPGKETLTGTEWLATQNHLYGGYAVSGGVTETLGLLASAILALLIRQRRAPFILAALTAACFAGTLIIFAFGNNPINVKIARWTPATLPADWRKVGDAWQVYHALSALLMALAFGMLIALVFVPTESWKVATRSVATNSDRRNSGPSGTT